MRSLVWWTKLSSGAITTDVRRTANISQSSDTVRQPLLTEASLEQKGLSIAPSVQRFGCDWLELFFSVLWVAQSTKNSSYRSVSPVTRMVEGFKHLQRIANPKRAWVTDIRCKKRYEIRFAVDFPTYQKRYLQRSVRYSTNADKGSRVVALSHTVFSFLTLPLFFIVTWHLILRRKGLQRRWTETLAFQAMLERNLGREWSWTLPLSCWITEPIKSIFQSIESSFLIPAHLTPIYSSVLISFYFACKNGHSSI